MKGIIFILLAFLLGCRAAAFNEGKSVMTPEHPVLRTETLALPSEGRVKKLEGKALLLKKFQHEEGYKDLAVGSVVNDGDILVLYDKSIVALDFPTAQSMILQSNDKSRWFTVRIEPR